MTLRLLYPVAIAIFWLGLAAPLMASAPTLTIGERMVGFFSNSVSPLDQAAQDIQDDPVVDLVTEVVEALSSSDADRLVGYLANDSARLQADRDWLLAVTWANGVAAAMQDTRDTSTDPVIVFLESYDYGENWYLNSVSEGLQAFRHFTKKNYLISAQHVDAAMSIIPTELSARALHARLTASKAAMLLYAFQGNPEFLLQAAIVLKETLATQGQPIDRYELMTNFVTTLNRARDYESAAMVAELLLDEPKPANAFPGLAESYMAVTFNEIGEHERARDLSAYALNASSHRVVTQTANLEHIVALAGLGRETAARREMAALGWNYSPHELLNTVNEQAVLHAEALLAMHRGETAFALALMKRRADKLVTRVQSANSGNMSAMLSNLENTRSRQAEREDALQREAELRAIQLEQQNRLNRLLWVLICGLTLAFNLLLAFLRYREKTNAKVQKLQEDALSAEKMKTEFLGVINHELRTPLNGIIGISDAMIHHADDPVLRDQAQIVQDSGQILHDLLDSLITMSTIEGDRLELDETAFSLSEMISREAALWEAPAAEKSLDFTWYVGPELIPDVYGDAVHLRQCVRYLLSNAMRFTHAGRVHLHATAQPDADGQLELTLIVADTGQGISEDVQARLFKPFLQADATMTRKYGGAGLSLAIAQKLARMMGGDVSVVSREGRGSEFTLTARLPVAGARSDAIASETEERVEAVNAGPHTAIRKTAPTVPGDPHVLQGLGVEHLDAPEEIIDLMLAHPLLKEPEDGEREPEPDRNRDRRAAG
ncbi:MAG: HAMP domain-containing sensor histidine kinase [Pseudomonadota bacterium]